MAVKQFYTGIDLQKNELQNAVWHKLESAPSNPSAGQEYYNTTSNKAYLYNGTEWIDITTHTVSEVVVDATYTTLADYITNVYDPATFGEGDVLVLSSATDPEQRSWINLGTNTGTATDFTALSSAYDSTEIKALFTAGSGLEYSDGQFSVLDDGITASMINADVAGDGLEANATTGALDVKVDDSTVEIVGDTVQLKDDGVTQAKLDPTLEAKVVSAYAETIGDGTTTEFFIDHNLGTTDVITQIFDVSTGKCVECDAYRTNANRVTLGFYPAPTTDNIRVLIQKMVTA